MNPTSRLLIRLAAAFGFIAVATGAFGAHFLKNRFLLHQLDADHLLDIYEKGVQYQFYHSLALALAGLLLAHRPDSKWLPRAGWLFVAGMVFFSGSLYLLACRDLLSFPVTWAGPVTPIGGVCFMGGWLAVFLGMRE